ncbi:MAG TPA: 3'(2'),5'-bisphosphate nucleotidase CysQ [Acidimicrobiia bacterium]|nr:3'(2'),5'-bisphosphate nucleotidase CysQ [Acidimicrobiia bacterium]
MTVDDHALAADVARRAGELLLDLRTRGASKDDGDRESNELILRALADARPGDAVLSEEAKDDRVRLDRERVWIVDPLDGTREFGEAGRSDWAVHVALVVQGTPHACAVALPAQDGLVLSTASPPALAPASDGPLRLVVSRSRPPRLAEALAASLGAELVPLGSAGAKAMAIVQGHADVYAHAGGQYEWDSAAPVGVARAAGCHCSRIDGTPLVYNRPDPYLPDLLVCRPELARRVLDAIAAAGETG